MRARIRTADYEMEYEGPPGLWNEALRPVFGGPEAPEEPEAAPRDPQPERDPTGSSSRRDGPRAAAGDAWERLAEAGGRRGEKDAVLLAVHELGGARSEVSFDDVARVVHAHDAFRDVRVKPHLLKHVNRTKMLEAGSARERVRLTPKGRRHVQGLLE